MSEYVWYIDYTKESTKRLTKRLPNVTPDSLIQEVYLEFRMSTLLNCYDYGLLKDSSEKNNCSSQLIEHIAYSIIGRNAIILHFYLLYIPKNILG